jgi:SAM-dependent methyltransferase
MPSLVCTGCKQVIPAQRTETGRTIPLFTPPPTGLVPSDKQPRGPGIGTPWRQANWRFLEQQVKALEPAALILDVGAGRGDFATLFAERNCLALDIYPYPEVDLVCDLTQVMPFKPASFDAIALMNVIEHVYDTHSLFGALSKLLKPDGRIFVAIPFMVKIHQAPVDFVRFTHFALRKLGQQHGMDIELLEGYYDPVFFMEEGIGNLRWSTLPSLSGSKRYLARGLVTGLQVLASSLGGVLGKGKTMPPENARGWAPTGYHVVYRKPQDNP